MTGRRWTPRNHAFSGLFVFLLLAMFALLCLLTVFLSVRSYTGIDRDISAQAQERVLTGYLRGKVRAGDRSGEILLMETDHGQALCLRQQDWETRIYAYQGALMEQLCQTGDPFDPELGERIAEAEGLTGERCGQRLTLTVARQALPPLTLTLALRADGEVTP